MARYEHLPIFKTLYDLLIRTMFLIGHFPREYKYTLGERIQNTLFDAILFVYKANSTEDKVPHLEKILKNMQLCNIYMRVAADMRLMNTDKHADYILTSDSISKQTQGWINSILIEKREKIPT